jgi:nicotinamide-nucleotide amidase
VKVSVLSIGDELLGGRITDTNAAFLWREVAACGGRVQEGATVADERGTIASSAARLAAVSDVLITTGGLGPTSDDLTRWAAADLIDGGEVIDDNAALAAVRDWCRAAGLPASEAREMVAKRPPSASFLSNDQGTAPGLRFQIGDCEVWMLPGPPAEMESMFRRHVAPAMRSATGVASDPHEVLAAGLTEVQAADRLGSRLDRHLRPQLGIRVGQGLVRVTAQDPDGKCDQAILAEAAADVRRALEPWSIPQQCRSLPEAVGAALNVAGLGCATAESCTGGLLGGALTEVPGASLWYAGGWVTYSNEMKIRQLGVPRDLLEPGGPGAVSAEVVEAMARGARASSGADIAVSVSGVAGPQGGTAEKPVGMVWIGLSDAQGTTARCILAPGDRQRIRVATIEAALQWLRFRVTEVDAALPWERTE